MTQQLLDLSGKIDEFTVELFQAIQNGAGLVGTPFFVVGATARDMVLKHGYGIETIRATDDIDLGVEVGSLDEYARLKEALIKTGKFDPTAERQRLLYQRVLSLDLIPFGEFTGPGRSFLWPPENEVKMNTLGFEESFQHSLIVRLKQKPDLLIRFANPTGLALLKLISWDDHPERNKDAKDLKLLMRNHISAGNETRFFEEEADIVDILAEKGGFDYERGGARLLGRDISDLARAETRDRLLNILQRETDERGKFRLVVDMADVPSEVSTEFEKNIALLEEFKAGFLEGPASK
jgi:predicted nucleotidyltransferase